jgi:hypothetical protein
MPRCWLVLMRFWLRVDGCLVRLRDVRHFCRCVYSAFFHLCDIWREDMAVVFVKLASRNVRHFCRGDQCS